MRIAILAPESFPHTWTALPGGITHYVAAMAEGYASLGHDVHVFARADTAICTRWASTTVHYVKASGRVGLLRPINLLIDEIRLWRAFRGVARTEGFDLVEVIDWDVAALLTVAFVKQGILLVKLHGPREYIARLNGRKIRRLNRFSAWRERWIATRADVLLSADPALARAMSEMWSLPRLPETIPDPVHLPDLSSPVPRGGTEFRILAVGKLARSKDQATLIRALGRLAEFGTSWSATLVGTDTQTAPGGGSYKAFLMQQASGSVRENLIWIDGLPREQLWDYYSRSDVVVVCTVDGAYGYTTLDAMSAGRPVITTEGRAGAQSPYVHHGATAWVYPSGDDSALAEALSVLSRDQDMCARLGGAARAFIGQDLSPKHVAEQVIVRAGL